MKQTLDTLIDESKAAFEDVKNKIEGASVEFSDDASTFWAELKTQFDAVSTKLEDASREYADKAEKSAYLSMMEAKYKLLDLQELTERFSKDVLNAAEKKIDVAKYEAELAKFKVEGTWEKMKDEIADAYETSKDEVEKIAVAVGNEVKEIFAKLKSLV